ncbi:MAG: protein kinase [Fuerstiella sp.]|nr:serine/threonine protein kinase [Fuerstiella sp.]
MSMFKKVFGDQPEKHEKVDLSKRFNLIARVGQGSMSRVWRADDAMNGRFVAIKILDKEKTERYEARFPGLNKPTEADIALSVKHPNIVRTLESGWTLEDEMYLVMEYVVGSGLGLLVDLQSDQMRRYRLRYMIQIGEALHHFHVNSWIHRDICPRNILITEDNQVKLIDFGLTVPDTSDFRKPGNRTGTANYMAPELIKRQPTDLRIDVFSYAVTCFEMYTKRHPWDAALTLDAVLQHINLPPVRITELVPKMDAEIAEIIMKGLETNPANRWQTVDEMVTALRSVEARLVRKTRELVVKRKQAAANRKSNGKPAPAKNGVAQETDGDSSKRKSRQRKDRVAQDEDATPAQIDGKNVAAGEDAAEKEPTKSASIKSGKGQSPKGKRTKKKSDRSEIASKQTADDESDDAENIDSDAPPQKTDSPTAAETDPAADKDVESTQADAEAVEADGTEGADSDEVT